jgi:hypothetical protein
MLPACASSRSFFKTTDTFTKFGITAKGCHSKEEFPNFMQSVTTEWRTHQVTLTPVNIET